MIQSKEDILQHQLDTPYHQNTPFGEERARYLFHLLTEGWSAFTVMGKSCEISAFARVDIAGSGKIAVKRLRLRGSIAFRIVHIPVFFLGL